MRKAVMIFTVLTVICALETAPAATPPGFTGRIIVESKQVLPGAAFIIKVLLDGNNYPVTSMKIPLKISSPYLTCNYVDFSGSLKGSSMEGYYRISGSEVELSFIPAVVFPLAAIAADSGLIATLYMSASAAAPDIDVRIDSSNVLSSFEQGGTIFQSWKRPELTDSTGGTTLLPDYTAGVVRIRHSTDIAADDKPILPTEVELGQNFPNPFNPTTAIRFALPERAQIHLEIFNLIGQRVAILADQDFSAGTHTVTWDASQSPSGVYFYRLLAGDKTLTRKMLLMK